MDLALTLDYELFGDGSGDIFTDVIQPTSRILNICNTQNAKITIFFEVVEYWRLKEQWNKGNNMGYTQNPASAMEKQIIEACCDGHDIQLHIHPQWLNARYNNSWEVDNNWCMKDIPLSKTDSFTMDLRSVLQKGKETLEQILTPESAAYCCNIFRAGGFNILPSQPTIKILQDIGFKMDSSVYYGGYENNNETDIDFRLLKNNIPYWYIQDGDVLSQKKPENKQEQMVEIPIFSSSFLRYTKYDLTRLKILLNNRNSAQKTLQSKMAKKTLFQKIKFFFEYEYLTWDFCLFNISKMEIFIELAQNLQSKNNNYHPFVLIGHAKGFTSDNTLKYLLNSDVKNNFITLTHVLKKVNTNEYQ
jgi:hypothetical protein